MVPRSLTGENGALAFSLRDALYFRLIDELPCGMELTRDSRRALYVLLREHKTENASWRRTRADLVLHGKRDVRIAIGDVVSDIARRARTYVHGMRGVESKPEVLGGTHVFRGTRVPVRDIGELIKRGVSREDLEADYPTLRHLDDEDFEFAAMFAERNRPRGRPRQPIELRRAATDLRKR